MSDPILQVEGIEVSYATPRRFGRRRGEAKPAAIQDVSFSIAEGETLALVGESGSGKTTIGRAILGLTPVTKGAIRLDGTDITGLTGARRRALASDVQVIFQNPYGSLNPSLTVGAILTEPLRVRRSLSRSESLDVVARLLERVGMPADAATRYPGSFSGGQRQRIAIARALSVDPRLVICDEPTSALDVSTQATVLDLLAQLRAETKMTYLFITHDLAVVRRFADRVAVLDHGRIVELGSARDVCEAPQNPYTQALVGAAPVPDPIVQRGRREARLAAARTRATETHAGSNR